ncbi:MAG: DUF4294 domain-containing protein [Bacteroidota bacterium]
MNFASAKGQEQRDSLLDATILERVILDGDTFFVTSLDPVYVFPTHDFNWWQKRKYRRLVHNVKKVYPYAKLAGEMLFELNQEMVQLETDRQRKSFIKQMEDTIRAEYEDDLKKLTITQGKILIKLIDRETGNTSYNLVKELRGSFSAFFWQALARLFGSNLKTNYDPAGEDALIEEIVKKIELGMI